MSGAIWTNTMPGKLLSGLEAAGVANATALAKDVYGNPVAWIKKYPVGTVERHAVEFAYRDVQRLICIAGMCITSLLAIISWGLSNPRLGEHQSLEDEQLHELGTVDKIEAHELSSNAGRKIDVETSVLDRKVATQ